VNDQRRGFLLVLFASVCLSTAPTVVKIGLNTGADPVQLLAPRMVLGAGLLWLWVGLSRPQRARIDRKGLGYAALIGALNAASLVFFYVGLRRIDASVAILTFSVYPAMLLLMLHLRGEKVTQRDMLRLVLAVAGIALVADPGGNADPIGVVLVLGCAFTYALYVLLVHTRMASYPPSTTTLWMVTFLTIAVLFVRPLFEPQGALAAEGWVVVVWTGVVATAVARLSGIAGIRLLGGGQSALLLPAQTVMTLSWAAVFLGERMTAWQGLGAALVLTSILLAKTLRRGNSGKSDPVPPQAS